MKPGKHAALLLISAAAVAVAFGGCSSTEQDNRPATAAAPAPAPAPEPVEPAAPAAAAPTLAPTATTVAPAGGKAFAYFYRKKTILGGALNTSVHVDGVEVADLDPGTYVKVPLEPGPHAFYSDEKDDTLTETVEAGKEYYFRIDLQAGMWKGHGVLNRLDPAVGAPEFEKWKLKPAEDVRKPEMVVTDPRKP